MFRKDKVFSVDVVQQQKGASGQAGCDTADQVMDDNPKPSSPQADDFKFEINDTPTKKSNKKKCDDNVEYTELRSIFEQQKQCLMENLINGATNAPTNNAYIVSSFVVEELEKLCGDTDEKLENNGIKTAAYLSKLIQEDKLENILIEGLTALSQSKLQWDNDVCYIIFRCFFLCLWFCSID